MLFMEYPTPTISEKMLFPFFQIFSNFLFIGIPAEICLKQIKSNNYNKQCHDAKLAIFRITTLLVLHHDIACLRHARFKRNI